MKLGTLLIATGTLALAGFGAWWWYARREGAWMLAAKVPRGTLFPCPGNVEQFATINATGGNQVEINLRTGQVRGPGSSGFKFNTCRTLSERQVEVEKQAALAQLEAAKPGPAEVAASIVGGVGNIVGGVFGGIGSLIGGTVKGATA